MSGNSLSILVFFITLAATFVAAWVGRKHSPADSNHGLAGHKLNRWWIGLSAGASANSGFIVTGAVGLGYTYGIQWLFLPIAWFLGDLVFWKFFPSRMNAVGRESGATTLSELLTTKSKNAIQTVTALVVAALILICLGGYTSAQWLAGQKFLAGAFALPDVAALALFASIIIAYTTIGGFRGSVYADSFQAVLRIAGTTLALGTVAWAALQDTTAFSVHINSAGSDFLKILPGNTVPSFIGFIVGYAAAAIGFGLGQPHLAARYLAGASPDETKAAQWIYIGFVQYTWIAMTLFGIILRGIMPALDDPETGLSSFFNKTMPPVLTGIIVADIFATIAATSNSLLVAMTQGVLNDLLPRLNIRSHGAVLFNFVTLLMGLATMLTSLNLGMSVVSMALSSVSLMGAGIAGAVMIRVLGWRRSPLSTLGSIIAGLTAAVVWKSLGYGSFLNEAAIGILTSLVTNRILLFSERDEPR